MPQVIHLNTIAELRAAAPAWDDLWQRSDCTSPLARAEPIADWLAHFAPASRFQALVVADEGRWLAALPLVEHRMAGVLRAGVLPCNAWPSGATLLWDAAATDDPAVGAAVSAGAAAIAVAAGVAGSGHARPGVVAGLGSRADRGGHALRPADPLARRPPGDRARLAGGIRPPLAQASPAACRLRLRKLAERGEVRFQLHAHLAPHEVEPLLRRAWETEDRGWKGAAGTSVLRTPGAAEFMLAQARWLAAEGRLLVGLSRLRPAERGFLLRSARQGRVPFVQDRLRSGFRACSRPAICCNITCCRPCMPIRR